MLLVPGVNDAMKNDRLRIPIDEAYVTVIGRATYRFARLEWAAVHYAEKAHRTQLWSRIQAKSLRSIEDAGLPH
jgi:hypothetical protein